MYIKLSCADQLHDHPVCRMAVAMVGLKCVYFLIPGGGTRDTNNILGILSEVNNNVLRRDHVESVHA